MKTLSKPRVDLIDALLAEADTGDITAALLEKDEHLTDALRAIFSLQFEHASLVFCGGTSLSKAHGLIERMSEDADIKVVLSEETAQWPGNKLRRYLGDGIRNAVLQAIGETGLVEDEERRRSLNGNRYIHSQWSYRRAYEGVAALRPNLQLELLVRRPVLPTTTSHIGALADRLAGQASPACAVTVVSVAETMAEKVLSFLRRFAQHRAGRMQQDWDTALVRHIYDVHCIASLRPQVLNEAMGAFALLVQGDVQEFGYQDPGFAEAPGLMLRGALRAASTDAQTRREYDTVLLPLVYGWTRPSFEEAWDSFHGLALRMLDEL